LRRWSSKFTLASYNRGDTLMKRANRRLFLQSIAATTLIGPIESASAQQPLQSKDIKVPLGYFPNLDNKDIYQFLDSGSTAYDAPPIGAPKNYSTKLTNGIVDIKFKRPVDTIANFPDPADPLQLSWAVKEHYKAVEGPDEGQLIAEFTVVVTKSVRIKMKVWALLFIKDGTSESVRSLIVTAFSNYPAGSDPLDYTRTQLKAQSLSADIFAIAYTFSLEKVGAVDVEESQKNALLTLYAGKSTNGTVSPDPKGEPQGMSDYFKKRNIRLILLFRDLPGRVPEKERADTTHQVEKKSNTTSAAILDRMGAADAEKSACGAVEQHNWPIMTVLVWPEFRVDWRDFTYDIGCGVRVVLRLPVLQTQTSGLELWAYTRYPKDLGARALDIVGKCAVHAALFGTVIGIVLSDFDAAMAAFVTAFEKCILDHYDETVSCMVPGIGLIQTVQKAWSDVKI
jgi:hypothetical protein